MDAINSANIPSKKISLKEKFSEINPFTNPERCNADTLEDYLEDKASILTDKLPQSGKSGYVIDKVVTSISSAIGQSVGEVADKAVEKTEEAKKIVKNSVEKIKSKKLEEHVRGAFKHAFSFSGTCIAGGAFIALAVVKAGVDTFNFGKNVVRQIIFNTLDNLEGTELRKLKDSDSLLKRAEKKVKDKAGNIKENHKTLGKLAGVSGDLALTLLAKPALRLADAGKLVHERMSIRGNERGVDYKAQALEARSEYDSTDKKVKDKIKFTAGKIKRNAKKIADVRAGDVARIAIASLNVVTSVTGILNVFSYADKIRDIL